MKKFVVVFPGGREEAIEAESWFYSDRHRNILFVRDGEALYDLYIPDSCVVYPEDFKWVTEEPLNTANANI